MTGIGFWIFFSVFWACETIMYLKGHNTLLFNHKTEAEKAIARMKISYPGLRVNRPNEEQNHDTDH